MGTSSSNGGNASVDEVLENWMVSTGMSVSQKQSSSHFIATSRKRAKVLPLSGLVLSKCFLEPLTTAIWSKFWTGLKSQQLRNSTWYLYATYKDFPSLLREIRKVEQKESCSQRPVQPARASAKQKVAQQHGSQVPTDQKDKSVDTSIQKLTSDLMTIVKCLEQKVNAQQQALAAANSGQSSAQHNSDYDSRDSQNYGSHYQRGKGCGYGRGQWCGCFGRDNTGNYQNNRGGFKGGNSRGSGRSGPNRRGFGRGSGSNQSSHLEN